MRMADRNLAGATYAGNRMTAQGQGDGWLDLGRTGAEVLLAQEARPVADVLPVPPGYDVTSLRPGSAWGSVVAVRHLDVDLRWRPAHQVLDAFGAYVGSSLLQVRGLEIAVVSVHSPTSWYPGLWEAVGKEGPAPSGRGRPWPSDVLLDALVDALRGREVIVAGDFNEALNYPADGDAGAAEWFGRTTRAGWLEVVATVFGGPVRTNFTRQAKRSYQNDHVFVSTTVAAAVQRVSVWNEPERSESDHAGIEVDFRLESLLRR